MKKKDEPNFYKLDQTNPLPAIHEAPIPGAAATNQAMRTGAPRPESPSQNVHNGSMHPHLGSMTQQHVNSMIVTPHVSPNQMGPSVIGGPNKYQLASPCGGNMNSIVSPMNGMSNMNMMGPGNIGIGHMNEMGSGGMGMGSMNAIGHGNMGMGSMTMSAGGMAGMGTNGMSMNMGTGSSSMHGIGSGTMNMYVGNHSARGNSFNSRLGGYSDSVGDCFQAEYDHTPHSPMIARGSSMSNGAGYMGGQQRPFYHQGHLNNNARLGDDYGQYSKLPPLHLENNIGRPSSMRQGSSTDHMHGGDHSFLAAT